MSKIEHPAKFPVMFWDLDGTLTASAPGIINGVKYALQAFGIEETDETKTKQFIGPPLSYSFKTFYGFSENDAQKAIEIYREYYNDKGIFENSVFEGVKPALQKLVQNGKKLFVATSKPEFFMTRILSHFELNDFFEFAGGADPKLCRNEKDQVIKYVIESNSLETYKNKGEILMIGDRKHDILGAKSNGIFSCGVLWGYGSKTEFEEFNADFIIEKPQDLVE